MERKTISVTTPVITVRWSYEKIQTHQRGTGTSKDQNREQKEKRIRMTNVWDFIVNVP